MLARTGCHLLLARLAAAWIAVVALACAGLALASGGPQPRLQVSAADPGRLEDAARWRPPPETPGWAYSLHEEQLRLAAHPGRAFRYSNQLGLRLENGNFALLADIGVDGTVAGHMCCEVHRFRDFWPDLGFHVVVVGYSEMGAAMLISARTAEATLLAELPHRNPWVADIAAAVLTSDSAGQKVEIWRADGEVWQRVYDCANPPYGTAFLRWDASDRLILSVPAAPGGQQEVAVSLQDGRWQSGICAAGSDR